MELTIKQALQKGVTAHKAGQLEEAERHYRTVLQFQPSHPDVNHNLGLIAVSVNKAEAALPLFESALAADPKKEQFWLSYLNALIKVQKSEKAEQVIWQAKKNGVAIEKLNAVFTQLETLTPADKLKPTSKKKKLIFQEKRKKIAEAKKEKKKKNQSGRSINPPNTELNSLLLLYQNKQFDQAETLAVSLTKEFPKHPFSWKVLGALLLQTGRNFEAKNVNQKLVKLSPKDAEAHSNLGVTLKNLGKLEAAEASFNQALELKPGNVETCSNLGNTLKELGKLKEAEARYKQAISLKPDYAEAHNNLGVTFQELGKFVEAEASFKQAIALRSDYAEARNNLGHTLHEQGRLAVAEEHYSKAIALRPDYAEAHNNLGNTLKELNRFEEAEARYKQAVALKPDYAEAHSNLGMTFQALGQLREAEASYKRAIALKPDYAEAHSNLGNILRELGRLDEAESSFTHAIALKPEYAEAHNSLGVMLKAIGKLEEAEASYLRAIALEPDHALAHFNLGRALYIKGDKDSSFESLEKAYGIDPKAKDHRLLQSIIRSIKIGEEGEVREDEESIQTAFKGLSSNPLIRHRDVERELITVLYQMSSREMEKTGTKDARFGNGTCSLDFNFFEDTSPIIKKVRDDLTKIMMEAVKSDIYVHDSFFNILGAGGGTIPHAHLTELDNDLWLYLGKHKYSLVYYLCVGDQSCNEPGTLKLYDPDEDILPLEGMITIIPSSRKHSAVYGGKTDRVMIGVNFYSL